MGKFFTFVGLGVVLALALLLAVVAGDYGPWYFAWIVGTVMIVLIAGCGAVLFDAQHESGKGDI
jgi:amino acid transporter